LLSSAIARSLLIDSQAERATWAAVPIHWGTYWPHALGRVFPERLVEPPAALVEYASELAPDVRMLPTAVGDVVEWVP